jgi:hypothetical protein
MIDCGDCNTVYEECYEECPGCNPAHYKPDITKPVDVQFIDWSLQEAERHWDNYEFGMRGGYVGYENTKAYLEHIKSSKEAEKKMRRTALQLEIGRLECLLEDYFNKL